MNIRKNLKHKGYTLIEMIVVVAVIAILLGLTATTMKNLVTSEGVDAGMPIVKAKCEEARMLALGRGAATKVVIYSDATNGSSETDKFLRYITIAQQDGSGNWVESGVGELLPKGCFLDMDASNGFVVVDVNLTSLGTRSCHTFEYSALGLAGVIVDEGSTSVDVLTDTSVLVLTTGHLSLSGTTLSLNRETVELNRAGILFGQNGGLIDVVDLGEIVN